MAEPARALFGRAQGTGRGDPGPAAGVSPPSRPADGLGEMGHSQNHNDDARLRPSQECYQRSGTGLVTVTEVKWCPPIDKQDCRVETELRSS